MKIYLTDIPDEGKEFTGELPGSVLHVNDQSLMPEGDVKYRLYLIKNNEIITAAGSLSASVRAICGRCSEYYPVKIAVNDFAVSLDIEGDAIDLSEDIREELLLRMPIIPKCTLTSKGLCPYSHSFTSVRQADSGMGESNEFPDVPSPENVWGVLDQLKNPEKNN